MTARMFAKHKSGLIDSNIFRAHDLICGLMLEHSILVNACLMCKCIRANDCLVWLHDNTRVIADQFADTRDLFCINSCFKIENRMTRLQGHDNFFERRIACTLANPIDGHFCLTRACANSCKCIRGCHAKIIMTMHGNCNSIVHARRILDNAIDQCIKFIGRGVTDCIRNVQGRCPSLDCLA